MPKRSQQNENPTSWKHPGRAEAVEIVFGPERISYRDILGVFIVAEALTNVVKRARATRATAWAAADNGVLALEVHDDASAATGRCSPRNYRCRHGDPREPDAR